MDNVFLVFGYGVPKDILRDENYNFYLKMVFNKIYSLVVKNKLCKPIIITCGGETDMLKPYKRTEADEMIKLFSKIFEEKIEYLRKAGPEAHVEAVKEWWDQKLIARVKN